MRTYEEIEYSNVSLQFEHQQIHRMVNELVEAGIAVAWRETRKFFSLTIQTIPAAQRLHFYKNGKNYRLRNRNYSIKDKRLSDILHKFIQEVKGHAVVKILSHDLLVVQNIRYGEPVRIIQIKGAQKKVLFEKECIVTMEQVLQALKRKDAEKRIPVLKLEIDYELTRLFVAIQNDNQIQTAQSKEVLERLRLEMIMLEI
jgi:hypothetical protein